MNKLAEQLSSDIAVRAAQKLAALNGGMEKDAFNIPPNIANKALAGAGLGALMGVGGTMAADTLSDYDPSFMDYVRAAVDNAARGGLIGGGIGALNV